MSRPTNLLPLSLLDLTWARLNTRLGPNHGVPHPPHAQGSRLNARLLHQVHHVVPPPEPTFGLRNSGVPRPYKRHPRSTAIAPRPQVPNAAAELRARVDALVNQPHEKYAAVDESLYTEEELLGVYADLLEHPATSAPKRVIKEPAVEEGVNGIIDIVARRLLGTRATEMNEETAVDMALGGPSFSSRLKARNLRSEEPSSAHVSEMKEERKGELIRWQDSADLHHRVLSRLQEIAEGMNEMQNLLASTSSGVVETAETLETKSRQPAIAVAILSTVEWKALVHACVEKGDATASELAVELMRRLAVDIPEDVLNDVLAMYANNGKVHEVEAFIARYTAGKPTERQRDLHIKSHLKSSSHDVTTALSTLHNYEAIALAPPMRSYTRLIAALFTAPSSTLNAQAWDLFSHMRYVAHPDPDVLLYSLIIRACAGTGASQSSLAAEPERALDLWTEMTVDRRLQPTVGAYNAVILACARSRNFAGDAYRLAKEMMDAHRDAFGNPFMKPDRETFCALLVAAKLAGDLARTRWILAEMLKYQVAGGREIAPLNEEAMMHVLHAYASYRPPFRRGETNVINELPSAAKKSDAAESPQEDEEILAVPEADKAFTSMPPQNRSEVIREAKALFDRIIEDNGISGTCGINVSDPDLTSGAFSQVLITPRLVNSYLSVYYMHGSLHEARTLYEELFHSLGVTRTLRTHVEALERCANPRTQSEREAALAFGETVWKEWCSAVDGAPQRIDTTRLIEKAYAAMIRLWTSVGKLGQAVTLVREFADKYPPQSVRSAAPKPKIRSTRTVLFAPKPLVRMSSTTEVSDDTVPPLLTFRSLELLHHQLVIDGRTADIGYLKYICKAYEGALRARRDKTIRA